MRCVWKFSDHRSKTHILGSPSITIICQIAATGRWFSEKMNETSTKFTIYIRNVYVWTWHGDIYLALRLVSKISEHGSKTHISGLASVFIICQNGAIGRWFSEKLNETSPKMIIYIRNIHVWTWHGNNYLSLRLVSTFSEHGSKTHFSGSANFFHNLPKWDNWALILRKIEWDQHKND